VVSSALTSPEDRSLVVTVPLWVWALTIAGLLTVLALDLAIVGRHPHEVGVREAARWVAVYVTLAALFAGGLFLLAGQDPATEFVAGYITEYSLSVDNLFVFLLIMGAFAVPRVNQHRVLLFGILIALVLRGAFIIAGAAAVARFSWVFYLFGAFLVLTAVKVVTQGGEDEEFRENAALHLVRRVLPVTEDYQGSRSFVRRARAGGRIRLMVTPMLLVMIAIGMTDLLFALDSIPAIFGLTKHPYIVFTANMFALMGLRQLYFLLGGLLRKLVYLSWGLGVILAFIGVKLVLEALHTNTLPFVHGGRPVAVPVIGIELSLAVIVGVLLITTAASLVKVRFFPAADDDPDEDDAGEDDAGEDDGTSPSAEERSALGRAEQQDRADATVPGSASAPATTPGS
jgi:tellurite resistance protein TerC